MVRNLQDELAYSTHSISGALEAIARAYGVRVCVTITELPTPDGRLSTSLWIFVPEEIHRAELGHPRDVIVDIENVPASGLGQLVCCALSVWVSVIEEHNRAP